MFTRRMFMTIGSIFFSLMLSASFAFGNDEDEINSALSNNTIENAAVELFWHINVEPSSIRLKESYQRARVYLEDNIECGDAYGGWIEWPSDVSDKVFQKQYTTLMAGFIAGRQLDVEVYAEGNVCVINLLQIRRR